MTNTVVGEPSVQRSRNSVYLRRIANQSALLFALALFGYPIVGSVISLLQIDSRVLSVPFRMAVALFSGWVILASRHLKIDTLRRVMIFIWCLYILRLLHDWLISNLEGADYALQFFIVSAVLPGFALMKVQAFEWRRFAIIGFVIASAGALLGLFGALFGGADVQESGVAGRLSLSALNPVSLGNQATSAILCGVVLWRAARFPHRLLMACAFILLLLCLILTGSKGPVLQLIACVGLWALRRGHALRFGLLGLPVLVWLAFSTENPLANRLSDSAEDSSTFERVEMINDSIAQIQNSPLIGSAFVELNSGYYPHNVFIEAGLAFGVPVALIFLGMFAIAAVRAWKALKTNFDLLGLLFFQGLLDAAIAGSIYGMTQLWVILAILPFAAALKTPKGAQLRSRSNLTGTAQSG